MSAISFRLNSQLCFLIEIINTHCVQKKRIPKHIAITRLNLRRFKHNSEYTAGHLFVSLVQNFNRIRLLVWALFSFLLSADNYRLQFSVYLLTDVISYFIECVLDAHSKHFTFTLIRIKMLLELTLELKRGFEWIKIGFHFPNTVYLFSGNFQRSVTLCPHINSINHRTQLLRSWFLKWTIWEGITQTSDWQSLSLNWFSSLHHRHWQD